MSFCIKPSVCKKCGKPLTLFEGWTCLECEKAEQDIPTMYYPQVDGITPTVVKAKKEPCDAISREDAIHAFDYLMGLNRAQIQDILFKLPSVRPQEQTGHWISIDTGKQVHLRDGMTTESVKCSECDEWLTASDEYTCYGRYCPSCGARMVEEQERSEE